MAAITKLQCGYEDTCKAKSCLKCPRKLKLKVKQLTLAEATCIEDFGVVDVPQWFSEKPKDAELSQNVMRKLMVKIRWE